MHWILFNKYKSFKVFIFKVNLKAENSTLHLSVALLDILLDSVHVPLNDLQAAAVASFWVAYKFVHGSLSVSVRKNLFPIILSLKN